MLIEIILLIGVVLVVFRKILTEKSQNNPLGFRLVKKYVVCFLFFCG